ncbi:hypothetical protein FVW20_05320 [Desulfovibrio oxamicus]|uniref:AlpA family phage regulatory protein n=1 Tax=Nitratidesulfovibrio oxamicus TaxID=32016 RepID=A0ABS0J231_9BACT|nr:hypothetical protein [Nitratidesulfovibrio oxamicus]MBG3876464.1 hypothetical protein [Nitratidesulfovibrio oxamicus]
MTDLLSRMDFPALFPRVAVGRLTSGIIQPKTLANLDSLGLGPSKRWRVGRSIFYERDSFIEWFASRVKVPESKTIRGGKPAPQSRSAEVLGYLTDGFGVG